MAYYSEQVVSEVCAANDIVDVISESGVRLQKKGSQYFGLCPFHNEKTPSFSVSRDKQLYYCFGCGAGGNVITFRMQYENDTFREAVEALAARAGIQLPDRGTGREEREEAEKRARILRVNKEAARYFYAQLRMEQGKVGMAYFKGRGLSPDTLQKFGLGYSNKFSDDLYQYLKKKGYDDGILKDAGVISLDGRGAHDRFWNRVMFPIMDAGSHVIGFGGRVMGDGKPKYLNSPETPVFDKGRNLYGLNLAKSTRRPYFLLCEGYMDVIALHQAGFDNAVASLGTALTQGHAGLMKRYVREAYCTYDSDEAGIKAALRAIPILREAGIEVKVVSLEPYKDPDELIRAIGPEGYQERIDAAQGSFSFELSVLEREYDLRDPASKTAFFHAVAEKLLQFEEEIERDNYIEAVAEKYRIGPDKLRKLVISEAGKSGALRQPLKSGVRKKKAKEDGVRTSQKLMLAWMAGDQTLFEAIRPFLGPEDFTEELLRKVADAIYGQYEEGKPDPAQIISMFEDGEQQSEAASIFHAGVSDLTTPEEKAKALRETVTRVKENSIAHRLRELDQTDSEGLQKLIAEKKEAEKLSRMDFVGIFKEG